MTGEEIIEANKDLLIDAKVTKVGGMACVVGVEKETGEEIYVFWRGEITVSVSPKTYRHRGSARQIHETLRLAQPGKEFATVSDAS